MADSNLRFTVPASAYASAYARRYACAWAAALSLPIVCGIIAGFYDLRWWFITMMCLFIVYPMVLVMAWFSLTGQPSMAMRLRPQECAFSPDGNLSVSYYAFDSDDTDEPIATECHNIRSIRTYGKYAAVITDSPAKSNLHLIPTRLVPDSMINSYS